MRLFLGGSSGLLLYEDGDLTELSDQPVECLTQPKKGRVVAGTEHGSILVWEGNGTRISAKDLGDGVHSLATGPRGQIFAGTIPAAAWVSKDLGETWSELPSFSEAPGAGDWTAPWGTPIASTIATHPKDGRTVYYGVEVGGVYRTRDGGKKWFDLGIPGADVHAIQVSPAKHERVYATTGEGSFCSDDGGYNWRPMGAGNRRQYTMGLAAHPLEVDRVIISAASGPPPTWNGRAGARCDIYLSTDSGRRFRTVAKDLKGGVQRKALVINPKVPSEVAFATSTGEVFYSNDGGESFHSETSKLGDLKAIAFA
jgi:photosystem II stability/assembly factor-like uncharacterized protein